MRATVNVTTHGSLVLEWPPACRRMTFSVMLQIVNGSLIWNVFASAARALNGIADNAVVLNMATIRPSGRVMTNVMIPASLDLEHTTLCYFKTRGLMRGIAAFCVSKAGFGCVSYA